jgi:hypothetical protein
MEVTEASTEVASTHDNVVEENTHLVRVYNHDEDAMRALLKLKY